MPSDLSVIFILVLIVFLIYKLISWHTSSDESDEDTVSQLFDRRPADKDSLSQSSDCRPSVDYLEPRQRQWTYADLLQTQEWEDFRQYIFSVRGTTCEWCRNPNARPLQVHHKYYLKYHGQRYLPWQYSPNDVMVVCKKCHQAIHRKYMIKTYARRPC